MSMSFTLKINPALIPNIEAACKRGLEICGGKAESYAKLKCPKRTSRLSNSISHRVNGKTMEVGTNVEYAPYVEFGHHQEPGRYVPAIGKRLVRDFVPGTPYIAPALEDHIGEYKDVLLGELNSL